MISRPCRRRVIIAIVACLLAVSCAPPEMASPAKEPVTIKFAYRQHTINTEQLIDAFQTEYPWITVEPVEAQRWGNQLDHMIETMDIDVLLDGRSALTWAESGHLRPLDEIQLGDWTDIRDDYFDGTWESLNVLGQQWGIPSGLDMMTVYVNVDQLEALQLDLPDANWDLLAFLQLATDMNYPDGLPYAEQIKLFGFCTDPEGVDPVIFTYLYGGSIVDSLNSPTIATLDKPQTIDAVEWYGDLFTTYEVAPYPDVIRKTYTRGRYYEAALRGACGVWIGLYSSRGGGDMNRPWSIKWAMLPLPHDQEVFGLGDVQAYYITSSSQQPQEAIAFLRWMADQPAASGQRLPPRRSLVASEVYEEIAGKEIAQMATTFADKVFVMPTDEEGPLMTVGAEFIGAVNQVVTENLPASQVLSDAQGRADLAFK